MLKGTNIMANKKILLIISTFFSLSVLAGCGEIKHTHDFKDEHDENSHYQVCECGEKINVNSHSFVDTVVPSNCEHGNIITHTCACGYTYTEEDNNIHNFITKFDSNQHWKECSLCHVKENLGNHDMELYSSTETAPGIILEEYKCKKCEYRETKSKTDYVEHNLVCSIKKAATCQEDGIKLYKCTDCDYSFEEPYSDVDAHNWNSGEVSGNKIIYRCQNEGCTETKTIISFVDSEEVVVDVSDLISEPNLTLKEASFNFEQASLVGFSGSVTVGAKKVSGEQISAKMPEETRKLLQNATILDLTFKNGDEEVHEFVGKVVVNIPYVLKENQDPDNIGVVYVKENGEMEDFACKYSNGFVSFETNHFSYFAILEFDNEDACAVLGHNYYVARTVESSCTKQGYIQKSCKRCGHNDFEMLPLIQHKYNLINSVPSTTTTHGYNEFKCDVCGDTYQTELPLIIEGDDDNYMLNFFRSSIGDGFEASMVETEKARDYYSNMKFVLCLEDGNDFAYSSSESPSYTTYSFYDDQYSYYNYSYKYSSPIVPILKNISNALTNLPSSLNNLFEKVELFFNRIGIVKENIGDHAHLYFDKEIAKTFVNKARMLYAPQLVDYLLGDGTYDDLLSFAERSYNRTIQETIDELGEFGINVSDLYPMVASIWNIPQSYDELFTDELLSSKLSDIVSNYAGVPVTWDIIYSRYVEPYESKTVFEIISEIANIELQLMTKLIDSFAEVYINETEFSALTLKSGQIINGTVSFPGYSLRSFPKSAEEDIDLILNGTINGTFSKNFNRDAYKQEKENYFKKCEQIEEDFTFTDENNLVLNILEEYYGLSFTVVADKDETSPTYGMMIFISEPTDKFSDYISNNQYINPEVIPEDGKISSQVIYSVDVSSVKSMLSSRYFYSGCKGSLNPDHDYIRLYSDLRYKGFSSFLYLVDYETSVSFTDKLSSFYYMYDIDTREFSLVPTNELEHHYTYTKISYQEFSKHYYSMTYPEDYDYYKQTCKDCSYVTYTYVKKGFIPHNGYLTSNDFNDEANKYTFKLSDDYYYGGHYYSDNDRVTNIYVNNLYSFYDGEYPLTICRNNGYIGQTFNYGNVQISVSYTAKCECTYIENVKITCEGKELIAFSNTLHNVSNPQRNVIRTYSKGCEDYEEYEYVCSVCGNVIEHGENYIGNHHNYELVETFEPTETLNGYKIYKCSSCGSTSSETINRHYHNVLSNYNSETGETSYYCECGATWDAYPNFDFVLENLSYLKDNVRSYSSSSVLSDDCTLYSIADLCRSYAIYPSGFEPVLVGVKNGEIDLDYMLSLGEDRVKEYYFSNSYLSNFFYGFTIEQNEIINFKSTLPNGYDYDVLLIHFINVPDDKLEFMESSIGNVAEKLSIDSSKIEEQVFEERYNDVYQLSFSENCSYKLDDCSLDDFVQNELVPSNFYVYYPSFYDNYYYLNARYDDFELYITFDNISFDDECYNADVNVRIRYTLNKRY